MLSAQMKDAFTRGTGHGLLWLGTGETEELPAVLAWWRDFGTRYVAALRALPEENVGADGIRVPLPSLDALLQMAGEAHPMKGGEYLSAGVLVDLWDGLNGALTVELDETELSVQDFLKQRNPAWILVGRVHFNLAENRKDEERPFAFLATYTTGLSAQGRARHLPLGQALREYAGAAHKDSLLNLLMPVQRAAESCTWLKQIVDNGEIFHPLHWQPQDALRFLHDVAALESAGVVSTECLRTGG